MADREKVIKELEEVKEYIRTRSNGSGSKICRLMDVCNAAIILLKEQAQQINEISDEYIDLGREMAKLPKVVLCKDCKHGEKPPTFQYYPEITWCNKHSTSHNDDWFCADGERR